VLTECLHGRVRDAPQEYFFVLRTQGAARYGCGGRRCLHGRTGSLSPYGDGAQVDEVPAHTSSAPSGHLLLKEKALGRM